MSLLFTDANMTAGKTLITFGTKKDVCLFEYREAMQDKPVSEQLKVRKELEGKLEGKKVIKFRNSGAEIVISFDYIHKLAELHPKEKELSESAESEQEDPGAKES